MSSHLPDLDSLELLLTVSSTGSLGKAATVHGLGQPAVTARIKRIEALVGMSLLDRSPRGSTLTPAGALVVDWARAVITAAEGLDAGIASLLAQRGSRLRVAASLTVAEHLLPRWLVTLAASAPDLAVSLVAVNSASVADAVLSRDVDLGFVEGPRVPAGLTFRVIARDTLVLVVPPGHPWARRRRPIGAAELAATRLVHREAASGTRVSLDAALSAHAPFAPALLEFSTATAVRSAVLAGAGPAVLSSLSVNGDLAARHLIGVPVQDVDLHRDLRAVWPTGQPPPRAGPGPPRDRRSNRSLTSTPGATTGAGSAAMMLSGAGAISARKW